MATSTNELQRLKAAQGKPKGVGENPIKDGPNSVLDAEALAIAQELADEYGMEKLRTLFPDMAALLEGQPEE